MDPAAEQRSRRRAGLGLAGILLSLLAVVGVVAALVIARNVTAPPNTPQHQAPPGASVDAGPATEPGWDVAAQRALALRPMLVLPAEAAQPRELTTQTAGPDIPLPAPAETVGRWIPGGFPRTPEGALAQLKAFNETGVQGGDPAIYARAYAEMSLPGAPVVERTGLHTLLTSFRKRVGIAAGETMPGLSVRYEATHGLIKGSTDEGRYVVVCTLGQLSFDYKGQTIALGVGDCQALRWTGTAWRISPGVQAALASNAWPGSLEAVKAGYRALGGGA